MPPVTAAPVYVAPPPPPAEVQVESASEYVADENATIEDPNDLAHAAADVMGTDHGWVGQAPADDDMMMAPAVSELPPSTNQPPDPKLARKKRELIQVKNSLSTIQTFIPTFLVVDVLVLVAIILKFTMGKESVYAILPLWLLLALIIAVPAATAFFMLQAKNLIGRKEILSAEVG